MFALLPLLACGLTPGTAGAQPAPQYANAVAMPRIDGFNVDEVAHLAAGTELNFSLYGTPGGAATLHIAGAQRNLVLYETDVGQYEGVYTISSRDRISAGSAVTANLRLGNRVVSKVLSESLQAGVGYHAPRQADAGFPNITRFDVRPGTDLGSGNELAFSLSGTPAGKAEIAIAGVKGRFFLQEVRSGEYAGIYTIKRRDRIAPDSAVSAELRVGDRITSATLGKPLQMAAAAAPVAQKICASCGTVEAVNLVEVTGDGGYLGAIGGGVIGGLLGNQVGGGNGKTAATVAGMLGGALAGRAIEGNVKKTMHHEVLVRLQNGGTQTISFDSDPGYRIGDKVRITDGALSRTM